MLLIKIHFSSVRMQLVGDSVCVFVRASVSCYLTTVNSVWCRASVRLQVECRVVCLASGHVLFILFIYLLHLLQSKSELIVTANAVISNGEKLVEFAQILAKYCISER